MVIIAPPGWSPRKHPNAARTCSQGAANDKNPAVRLGLEALAIAYTHPDVADLALFDTGSDSRVLAYWPVFAAPGKTAFGRPRRPKRWTDFDWQRQSLLADPGYRTGFTGHDTMVMPKSGLPGPAIIIVHLEGCGSWSQ
jgi:hypothetical protein